MPIPSLPPIARGSAALALAALLALAAPAVAQEGAPPPVVDLGEDGYAALVATAVDTHVRPAYEQFAATADLLATDVHGLCETRDAAALATARRAFEATARGYFALLPVRIGPILENNRQERLAFWPDPRGLGLKQVQQILARKDASATDPATLAAKSVGVQGLTALEFLIYGADGDALATPGGDGDFRCAYAGAAAANVDRIAREMFEAWGEGGAATTLMTVPGPRNPLFQTHKEAAGKLVGTVAAGLEILADSMVAAPFGPDPERAKPKIAPFWRSGQSLPSVVAALEATEHLMTVSGVTEKLGKEQAWLGNAILFELRKAAENARTVTLPIDRAVADKASRDAMRYVAVAVGDLKRGIGRDLAAGIGLEQGFNANDGD